MPPPPNPKQLRLELGLPAPAEPRAVPPSPPPPAKTAWPHPRPSPPARRAAQPAGLDYTHAMTALISDIVQRCPDFRHIQVDRVLVSFSQARVDAPHGQFAKVVPLRFEKGADTLSQGRRTWIMPRLEFKGRNILYLVYFCMPKFQNLKFGEKVLTIFHELYHVSPEFDGDIRRFPGRNYAHGHSRAAYNALVSELVAPYLALVGEAHPPLRFLHPDFASLEREHGRVVGLRVAVPRPQLRR